MAGDLNMSDRVVSYRKMDAALTDAMRAGAPGSTTYVGGWWPTLLLRPVSIGRRLAQRLSTMGAVRDRPLTT